MEMNFTVEQKKVIDLRNRNILVSAAAGSGKTAVLVERIIARLTKDKEPIDVDELLIVTYTEAAASEMKERIRDAIEQALEDNPENVHLQRQATLIHSAQVTTIHSFCLSVIRDYFHTIDLDPAFRIAEEGELKLLKRDVLEELLESYYATSKQDFLNFVESFASGRDDKKIEELILQLYEFSRSYPNPKRWLERCVEQYDVTSVRELEETPFVQQILRQVHRYLEDLEELLESAIEVCEEEDGPYMYRDTLESDKRTIEHLHRTSTFSELYQAIAQVKWGKLAANRDKSVSPEHAEYVKGIREETKKKITSIQEQYFFETPEQLCEDMCHAKENMSVLVSLVLDFASAFAEKKSSKNLIDFGDMEQFALQILTEEQEGVLVPSKVAEEYQQRFKEVMIDEYQDSNLIQEAILTSVSSVSKGIYNLFMVGDVKQSIYRFRLSRPELFMEKFHTYHLEDSEKQRIDLHKNFRSRREVLDSTNFIFEQIMTEGLGGIAYDEKVALYVGAAYEQIEGNETEVLLVDTDVEESEDLEIEETTRELEARAVARRIKELVGTHLVLDKKTGDYRPAQYRDIVILTRSLKGWTDVFTRILNREGIPAYSVSKEGYFETREIQTILDYLKILDNPRQDIPLASVLTSYFGMLSSEELALVKCSEKEHSLYECVMNYMENGEEEEIKAKLCCVMEQYRAFRKKVPYTAIHVLLEEIIEQTGYGSYIAALPAGEQREANLQMLVEKAINFEATSYKGLFHFVRYIEQLHKYDVDFGEANIIDEQADTVRLMSIHKSKGLEFPIVFVSGMSKKFNQQDVNGSIVIHADMGVGIDCVDLEHRTKKATLLKKMIQRDVQLENKGEELRVLYVAMTRAKEKLILTGTVSKLEQKLKKYVPIQNTTKTELLFSTLTKANSYLDWILPALCRHSSFAKLLETYGMHAPFTNPLYDKDVPIVIQHIGIETLVQAETEEELRGQYTKEILQQWDTEIVYDEKVKRQMEEQFDYVYAYEKERKLKQKMTVSELKKRAYLEEESGELLFENEELVPLLPKFMQDNTEIIGTSRGTVYHKLLELLDFSKLYEKEALQKEIASYKEAGIFSEEMAACIRVTDILHLLHSALGTRLQQAASAGTLHKEQPFVLGVDAAQIYEDDTLHEQILIQGIMDVYFEEEGDLVVVDYKTDYVRHAEELQEKYHAQLDYYAQALEQLTGKKVKEKIIYSFALKKEVYV